MMNVQSNDPKYDELTQIIADHISQKGLTNIEIYKEASVTSASMSDYVLDRVDFDKAVFYFAKKGADTVQAVPAGDIGALRLLKRRELMTVINNGPLMEWIQYCRNSGIGQVGWVVAPDEEEANVKIRMSEKKTPKTLTYKPQYLEQGEFDSINSFVVDAIKKESWVTFTHHADADMHRNTLKSLSFSKDKSCGLLTFDRPHPTRYGDTQETCYLIDPPTRKAFKSLVFKTGYICSFQTIWDWVRDCIQQGVKLIDKTGVHYDFEIDGEDDETEEKAQAVNGQKSEEEIAEIVGKILKAVEGCTAKTTARLFLYACINEVTMLNFDPKTGRVLTLDDYIFFKDIEVLQVMVGDKLQDRVTLTNQELKIAMKLANKPRGKAKKMKAAFVADDEYLRRLVDATDTAPANAPATEHLLDYDPNHPDIPTSYTPSAENKALLQKWDIVAEQLSKEKHLWVWVVRIAGAPINGKLNEINLDNMTYTLNAEYPLSKLEKMQIGNADGAIFTGDDFKIIQGLVSVRTREQLSRAVAEKFAQEKLHIRDYSWETFDNRLTDLEVELREKRKGAVEGTLSLLAGPAMSIALIGLYLKTNGGLKYQDANCTHNEYRVVSFDQIESLQTPALGEYPVLGAHLVKYAEDCTNMARNERKQRHLEEAYGVWRSDNSITLTPYAGPSYNESARGRTRTETENACTCVCPCCGGQKTPATTHLNNISKNKGNNFMKSLTNMFGDIFGGPIGSAKSVGIDARTNMMTGGVIINQNGKYIQASVVRDKVSLTSVPKGMTIGGMPAFVFPVPVSTLKQNDIIVRDTNEILVVHSIDDDVIVALSLDKQEKIEVVPVGTVFLPGVKLVRKLTPLLGNLGNMFGGAAPAGQAANPMGGINPMMMMAMGGFGDKETKPGDKKSSSEDDGENGDMMQMLMMSQMMGGQQTQGGGMNPMMMMALMNQGKGEGEGSMMQNMLMMQMMNGGGNMFGGNPSAVPNEPQDSPTKGPSKTKA
jgi:hypothetical protein